jgi:hypothetical protein
MAVGSGNLFLTGYEPGDGELIPVGDSMAASASPMTPEADQP